MNETQISKYIINWWNYDDWIVLSGVSLNWLPVINLANYSEGIIQTAHKIAYNGLLRFKSNRTFYLDKVETPILRVPKPIVKQFNLIINWIFYILVCETINDFKWVHLKVSNIERENNVLQCLPICLLIDNHSSISMVDFSGNQLSHWTQLNIDCLFKRL